MAKKQANKVARERRVLAQEAARIIVDHGIRDYRVAKVKAAERLGMNTRGALPGNAEVEQAIGEHLLLFGGDSHARLLYNMRQVALSAMCLLETFTPRLVGPVHAGTADENSTINLHVFADSPEAVAMFLAKRSISCQLYERRLKLRRGRNIRPDTFAGYAFLHDGESIEATVFPFDAIRQAPISPIDGKPMQRASIATVTQLVEAARFT